MLKLSITSRTFHIRSCLVLAAGISLFSSFSVSAENCSAAPEDGKYYRLVNRGSGLSLDIAGKSMTKGAKAMQWTYNGGGNQHFLATSLGDGYWSLKAEHSGMALDVARFSTEDGGSIVQYGYWGGNNQQWKLKKSSSGGFNIVSRHSSKSITVDGDSKGAKVYQKTDAGSSYQRWYFNPVDGVCATQKNIAPLATASTSYVSSWETLSAVNDNSNPANSGDKSSGAYGNWNNPNTTEWVQYDWSKNYRLSSTEIYWFDDDGGVLTPTTARFEYWDGSSWIKAGNLPLVKDSFNSLALDGIVTQRVRVSMLNSSQSTGILEWRVFGVETDEPASGECKKPAAGSKGSNPIIPGIFTASPAVLVHDCTFYIAAGHDEGSTGFLLRDWYQLSSTDMVNWSSNDGPVLSLDVFSWADSNAWASQMVERNGKFYWYVAVNETGVGMAIGVAVGDSPLGPFKDAIGGPLIGDASEMKQFNYSQASQTVYTIDPTVYVDDDGKAYLAYGGFGRMVMAELNDDMISLKGDMVEQRPQGFFEAPYLTKRNGTYYMVYAAGSNPTTIDYATSSSPMGPWEYGGQILDKLAGNANEDAPTSHPAIAEFAGQWYLVYHLSSGGSAGTYHRQVAIDKLEFNSDGSIQKVTPSSGLSFDGDGSENTSPQAKIAAVDDQSSGVTITLDGSGSSDQDGDTLTYSWKQTEGTTIKLSGTSNSTLSFVAPDVTQSTRFTFQLTVNDGDLSDVASVQFNVLPVVDSGDSACDYPEPPANMSAWIDESWQSQVSDNIRDRQAWLFDNAIKGKGQINLCVRWGATKKLTKANRDKIAPMMQRFFNEWYKGVGSYGCFPYPKGVTVKLTGVAVKPGAESLLEWDDNSVPIYTETDADGEPKCPDSCAFFSHWDHEFAGCAGGEANHFDYNVWLDDKLPGDGTAAAVGGDWGVRMPVDGFINTLDKATDPIVGHEIGHGFGLQDYYSWTGSRPAGGSVMIVGSFTGTPTRTEADSWLLRRLWKEQKALRNW